MTKSFGSQVRGGESSCRVRLSTQRVHNPGGLLDVAVALNWEDFQKFGPELPVSGATVIIQDEDAGAAVPFVGITPKEVISVPIGALAKKAAGTDRAKNSVVLGLIAEWFGLPRLAILAGINKRFAKKGAELVEANERAFALGEEFAREHPLSSPHKMNAPVGENTVKMLTDGNDMCAAGAIFAGCQFFGGYPITPSTEIMQYFTREVWKYGGAVLQAEDEIAGIGAAVGASFAGKKAMTATSGPGMALKSEMMGLASIAELPLVIVDVQRGGPSTGIPTKPEQSDLFMAAFSAHGDVLRPVLAPTSVADTFATTIACFNLAEQYQTPVILLSDQEIAQRKETVDKIDVSQFEILERRKPTEEDLKNYARFKMTDDRVSPISHPGIKGGNYQGAGIEHNERGNPTASGKMHEKMNDKRFSKLNPLMQRRDLFRIEGNPNAPLALIGWGSIAGICVEAYERAKAEGLDVKVLVPTLLYPIAEAVYNDFFASVKAGFVVELSHQGQLYRMLRMFVNVPAAMVPFCRDGANPFQPIEVLDKLRAAALDLQRLHTTLPQE
jgi:2-oxoglutarate ferredoxin oxidoreductase subunit alpha